MYWVFFAHDFPTNKKEFSTTFPFQLLLLSIVKLVVYQSLHRTEFMFSAVTYILRNERKFLEYS